MNITDLFKGVAVIIDNDVNDKEANIQKILNQLINSNIPFITYTELPSDRILSNFSNISFLLLDWDLGTVSSNDILEGIKLPDGINVSVVQENIRFIQQLQDICYCPIFIFSNKPIDSIVELLINSKLYSEDKQNHIFIKPKSDLTEESSLFTEIENWVKINPSIYVLKEWEKEYQKSKNSMFTEFQECSSIWPQIMWQNYIDDNSNPSLELGELIIRNLQTRMTPFEFSKDILNLNIKTSNDEWLKVLEGERYIANKYLEQHHISPGDLFKQHGDYLLNIRAACDLIPDRTNESSTIDDVQLYLLKGSKLSKEKTIKSFSQNYGRFQEHDEQIILFPINNGIAIDFHFKNLIIMQWSQVKDLRVGRILPPYITRIQQKYAYYLQRQGIPRTPQDAILTLNVGKEEAVGVEATLLE